MLFEHLKWDTDFFGYKTAMIDNQDISEEELISVIQELCKLKYRLVYLKINPENKKIIFLANNKNWFLADEKVTFSIILNKNEKINEYTEIKEYTENYVSEDLLSLALQSGEFSRFKVDSNFKNKEFEKLYKIWIQNSVEKKNAEKIFCYFIEKKIIGMISLTTKNKAGIISLIGVETEYRGHNIGKKLIETTKKHFINNGIESLDVVTHLKNVNACNFYKKCGFQISKIENIYHLWI